MIYVLSIISYDCALLGHFVRYYSSLGVDGFIIAIDERVPGISQKAERLAKRLKANIKLVPVSERQRLTGVEANNKEEIRQRYVAAEDWCIPADIDEFIEFPAPPRQLIAEMTASDATFIKGRFSDRISQTGQLTPLRQALSIWEQYPLECPVSQNLVRCWCHKVTLCRGDCTLTSGHHNVILPARPLIGRRCIIHHFKWRAGLLEALKSRIDTYKRAGEPWSPESERALEYLNKHERIVPEHFDATPGWNPDLPATVDNVVVYTAITNGYDELKAPPTELNKAAKFVAFTDREVASGQWEIRKVHAEFDDPCRNAKIHKILPHRYFPEVEYSLWIDGSITITMGYDFARLISVFLANHDMAVFRHRQRRCIYEEAAVCIAKKKDDPKIIRRQIARYQYESFPRGRGLAECTVILRRHTDQIRLFNEVWWEEIANHSRRDQLSFDYVAWKLGIKYQWLPGILSRNELFQAGLHAGLRRKNDDEDRHSAPFSTSTIQYRDTMQGDGGLVLCRKV